MYISKNPAVCQALNNINLSFITFGHAITDPGWHGKVVSPGFSRLYYILDGSFTVKNEVSEEFVLSAGSWYIIPSGYSFDFLCDCVMEHFYFHVKLSDFAGNDILEALKTPCRLDFKDCNVQFIKSCISGKNLSNGLILRQMIGDIILKFMDQYHVCVSKKDYSECILSALAYIKQNLSIQLTIPLIAQNLFISNSTLTKRFRMEIGVSVNEYVSNKVLEETEKLLLNSDMSVLEISQKFGFCDQFYFSRKFREKFGKSPSAYRKENMI